MSQPKDKAGTSKSKQQLHHPPPTTQNTSPSILSSPHKMFAIERFVATEEDGQEQRDVDQEKEKQDKLAQYLARVQQRRGENEKESKKKRKRDTSTGGQEEEQEEEKEGDAAPVHVKKDKEKKGKRKKERLAGAEGGEEEEEEQAVVASEGKQAKVRVWWLEGLCVALEGGQERWEYRYCRYIRFGVGFPLNFCMKR